LTAYFAAIIAHNVDQGGLHRQGLRFKTLLNRNLSLPSQLSIPSIVVKLSDILPNAVASSPTKFSEVEKVGGNATDASQARTTTELPAAQLATGGSQTKPTVKTQAANRTPWARDHVEIKYRNTAYSNEDADRTRLAYSADALVTVLDKRKFPMLKSKVGRDVLYNPIKGQFCIRLQASVGAPMMDKLKDRLKSVDRVVDCIDAMNHSRNTLKCESVTLQKVVFTYEDTMHRLLQQHLQQLKATESSAPSTASQPKRWQATLDLSGPQIKIEFEKGNPHTRILDILTTIVNQPDGICVLTEVLPQTIHPLSCLDRITASWRDLTKKNLGMPIVTHRTVDWFTICYDLPENATRTRSLRIDFKARRRDGKLYWYISRADPSVPGQPAGQPPQDIFAEKFKRVFQLKSVGTVGQWRGLGNGATMSGDGPLMALLALDQCVREAVVWADSSQGQQQGQQQGQRGAPGQARGTPQQGVRGIPNPGQASRK
jgi:mediator of RNA polymerase II transcription subunit 14